MTSDPEPPCKETPKSGWYARLEGDEVDLEHWRHSLNESPYPVADKLPDGQTVLSSVEFEEFSDASEVRERALTLINRLNGALNLCTGARAVRFGGIIRIEESGKQHTTMFAEAFSNVSIFGRASVTLHGPDGQPLPPPPPTLSQPQAWNSLAQQNDIISDVLVHFGRADNWYDIYKTIEFASHAVGGWHKLEKLVDGDTDAANLKENANVHRHAKVLRPPERLITLEEARPMLAVVVRKALSAFRSETK